MSTFEWLALLGVLLVLLAWYLSYSAARLDRLHTRVESTHAALDAQLVRRAEVTLELANTGVLDPASSLILASASAESLGVEEDDPDRWSIESELSEALQVAVSPGVIATIRDDDGPEAEILTRIGAAGMRVQLARRFHNTAVTDVRRFRRKLSVRTFRLAGHAPYPSTIEFDDELPAGLRG